MHSGVLPYALYVGKSTWRAALANSIFHFGSWLAILPVNSWKLSIVYKDFELFEWISCVLQAEPKTRGCAHNIKDPAAN
jgi:hypothetical protein